MSYLSGMPAYCPNTFVEGIIRATTASSCGMLILWIEGPDNRLYQVAADKVVLGLKKKPTLIKEPAHESQLDLVFSPV